MRGTVEIGVGASMEDIFGASSRLDWCTSPIALIASRNREFRRLDDARSCGDEIAFLLTPSAVLNCRMHDAHCGLPPRPRTDGVLVTPCVQADEDGAIVTFDGCSQRPFAWPPLISNCRPPGDASPKSAIAASIQQQVAVDRVRTAWMSIGETWRSRSVRVAPPPSTRAASSSTLQRTVPIWRKYFEDGAVWANEGDARFRASAAVASASALRRDPFRRLRRLRNRHPCMSMPRMLLYRCAALLMLAAGSAVFPACFAVRVARAPRGTCAFSRPTGRTGGRRRPIERR